MLVRGPRRLVMTAVHITNEIAGAARVSATVRSFLVFVRDIIGYRVVQVLGWDTRRFSRRVVKVRGGTELIYRLNTGDVRAIAETWFARAYELPVDVRSRNILDMGANIGATSLWLARRYGCTRLIAVEPAPGNADVLRANLARNGIDGEVVEAAVSSADGTARFDVADVSTLGRLGDRGIEVRLVTAQSLVDRFPPDTPIDLVKMDVEGAEVDVFSGDLDWLERVHNIVIEFHDAPGAADITRRLLELGFKRCDIASGNAYMGSNDSMVLFARSGRREQTARAA